MIRDGYENMICRIIRDALVEKIWEGTVEVLGHDLIRASRGKGVEDFCEVRFEIRSFSNPPFCY